MSVSNPTERADVHSFFDDETCTFSYVMAIQKITIVTQTAMLSLEM